jgi:glycosyltransferase involved in cell wall biosynthesis
MTSLLTVIPVYNGEAYLAATLASLATQTRQPDRVVVLDDCSTDATASIAQAFQLIPCEVVRNERNLGLFANHNRALHYAKEAEHLHILHANDLIRPLFYERLLAALERCPPPAMAFSEVEWIDAQGKAVWADDRQTIDATQELSPRAFLAAQAELKSISIDAAVLKTGRLPWPCPFRLDFPQLGDCVFHAESARFCTRVVKVIEKLTQVRLHAGSMTNRNAQDLQSWVLDEWRAMRLIAAWIDEPPPRRWLRQHKLKCLFAARSFVKADMVEPTDADYARAIRSALWQNVSPLHALCGRLAVTLRDSLARLRGRPTKTEELRRFSELK